MACRVLTFQEEMKIIREILLYMSHSARDDGEFDNCIESGGEYCRREHAATKRCS